MRRFMTVCAALALLSGCGIEGAIKRNDDRYMQPGALDFPLTGLYETYQYRFLDKYRITHQWLNSSNCGYGKYRTRAGRVGSSVETFAVDDIVEVGGKTYQVDERGKRDFDRSVRSVISEERHYTDASGQRKTFPSEQIGFHPLCFESWWTSSHYLRLRLQKRTLKELEQVFSDRYPEGQWTTKYLNGKVWRVQEVPLEKLRPRTGVGGPYQSWLLPLGDTGYTFALELGASKESLQYPEAHARFQTTFRHLIESVKIEPLNAQLEAEQAELAKKARTAVRKDCEAMAKRSGPSQWCKDLLAQPAD